MGTLVTVIAHLEMFCWLFYYFIICFYIVVDVRVIHKG